MVVKMESQEEEKVEREIDRESRWLIDNFRSFCYDRDDSFNFQINGLKDSEDCYKRLENQIVIDIGQGCPGASQGLTYFLFRNYKIKRYIGVDPYTCCNWNTDDNLIIDVNSDGLGYLVNQPDNSANILTFGLDGFVIKNDDYSKRLVDEIFRVVPEDGLYLSGSSTYLELYADKIFPVKDELSWGLKVYMKTPISRKEVK